MLNLSDTLTSAQGRAANRPRDHGGDRCRRSPRLGDRPRRVPPPWYEHVVGASNGDDGWLLGDVVPQQTGGRLIGAVLMLQGIGFITVVAASVTATLIEQARRRRQGGDRGATADQIEQLEGRLARIERALVAEESASREPDESAP